MIFSHLSLLFRLVYGSRVNVPGLRSIYQSIAKFSKTTRFLRYCPTWPKNWCVRLNPRAHFTRYRSEPIHVPGIFIHVVFVTRCSFITWRPTAVQASPAVFFYSQHCLSGRLSAQYARFESHVKRPSFKVRRRRRSDTRLVLLKLIVACAHDEYIASTYTVRLSRFYRFVNIRTIQAFGQPSI